MLKVGFIGLGTISSENVLGYLDSEDTQITAVSRRDAEAAGEWLKTWNQPQAKTYTNYEEMLAKEEFDIVEILTPHHLHHEQAIKCAQANVKGISLQKAMATTITECDEIIEVCKKNDVVLKLYENFVFYPVYLKAKELIDQGLIGELMTIRINTMTGLKDGAPWPWCWTPGSWSVDIEKSGTSPLIGDDGYHKFSLARWFMDRDIEKVSSWIDDETPLDAPAFIRAKYKKNSPSDKPRYAQVDFSFSPKLAIPCEFWFEDFIEIVGERGYMWINQCSAAGDRAFFKGAGDSMSQSPVFPPIAVFVDGQVQTYMEDISLSQRNWSTSFVGSTKHFIRVMKEGSRDPIYTGEEGREINRYAIAALLSAQEGRDVYIDEITPEAEANNEFKLKTNFCNV